MLFTFSLCFDQQNYRVLIISNIKHAWLDLTNFGVWFDFISSLEAQVIGQMVWKGQTKQKHYNNELLAKFKILMVGLALTSI